MEKCVIVVVGVMVAVFVEGMFAQSTTVHVVGDSMGWTVPQNPSEYSTWANPNKFFAGDILTFKFMNGRHDVVEVPKASYEGCSASNAIGNTFTASPTNFSLTQGHHYYICTFGDHCQSGQKLAIQVLSSQEPSHPPSPSNANVPSTPGSSSSPPPSVLAAVFFNLMSIALTLCFSM